VVIQLWRTFSLSAGILAYAVFVQVGLGVVTLLFHARLPIALTHQAGAMLVLMAAVWHLHRRLVMPEPDPNPR
jgi:heme a synthase